MSIGCIDCGWTITTLRGDSTKQRREGEAAPRGSAGAGAAALDSGRSYSYNRQNV
eukprot:COSAG06_NODE_39615_length_410_cov_1.993569_2_plen_54_part_01